jgi:micrococcal nuclease
MRCPLKRLSLVFLVLVLIFFVFSLPGSQITAADRAPARIVAVNDGDTVTIFMKGREQRCRLIGIDAPETGQEPWGLRAKEHLRSLLKAQRWQVSVETGLEMIDRYDRLLVYLWTKDSQLINEQMLEDGYAVLLTYQPNSKYADRFAKAQRTARQKKLGIWGLDGLQERPVDYKKNHPRE